MIVASWGYILAVLLEKLLLDFIEAFIIDLGSRLYLWDSDIVAILFRVNFDSQLFGDRVCSGGTS